MESKNYKGYTVQTVNLKSIVYDADGKAIAGFHSTKSGEGNPNNDSVKQAEQYIDSLKIEEYTVAWQIQVDAAGPFEAAIKAREAQTDPETIALVFDVIREGSLTRVDLLMDQKERPVVSYPEPDIVVEVRGGVAFCSDPRVRIVDYDNEPLTLGEIVEEVLRPFLCPLEEGDTYLDIFDRIYHSEFNSLASWKGIPICESFENLNCGYLLSLISSHPQYENAVLPYRNSL